MIEQVMLYKVGNTITCGDYHVDYIVVDADKVDQKLADGWFRHPAEAHEANQKEEEARKEAALQAQIEANQKAIDDANAGAGDPTLNADGQKTKKRIPKNAQTGNDQGTNDLPESDKE